MEVIICVGIPASGKSTFSKEFVKNNDNYFRLNRDSFRDMMKGYDSYDFNKYYKVEPLISETIKSMILSFSKTNYNLIIDETNLRISHLKDMIDTINKIESVIIKFKIFDVDVETAIKRDLDRGIFCVGEDVIQNMYEKYVNLIKCFDFNQYGEII